jgi:hypothetical protein
MEGSARAAKRRHDLAIVQAWHGEAFARAKLLKGLAHYLGTKPKPTRAQTPDEMFAALQMMHAGGAPLSIRQIN